MSSELDLELDLSTYDPERAEGGDYPGPGKAHVRLESFKPYGGKGGKSHKVVLEILAHSAGQDQVGRLQTEYINVGASSAYRLQELSVACGLQSRQDLAEYKKSGNWPTISWGKAIGCQFFVVLVEEEFDGKTRTRVGESGKGWYPLEHPKCAQYPRHDTLYMEARESAINGGLPKSKADLAASSQPATSGAASAPADDDF